MNEARAVTNLIGNGIATIAIAKWDGAFDQRRPRSSTNRMARRRPRIIDAEPEPEPLPTPLRLKLSNPKPKLSKGETSHEDRGHRRDYEADRLVDRQRLHRLLENDRCRSSPSSPTSMRDGRRVVGYGFNSNGRYGQGGLIRERFAPRMLEAPPESLLNDAGDNLDPDRIWATMMKNEKPGGHGERSVAVGTIDMAVWDAVAKIAGKPLFRLLAKRHGARGQSARVRLCGRRLLLPRQGHRRAAGRNAKLPRSRLHGRQDEDRRTASRRISPASKGC